MFWWMFPTSRLRRKKAKRFIGGRRRNRARQNCFPYTRPRASVSRVLFWTARIASISSSIFSVAAPARNSKTSNCKGFKKYGIWVTNCEGGEGPDRVIQFNRLEFVTTAKEQTALFFSIEPGMSKLFPKNRHFAFHDCKFVGEGTKVKTPDPATLENIEWPPNVQPVQGR